MVANPEELITPSNTSNNHKTQEGFGLYWNSKTSNPNNGQMISGWNGTTNVLNVRFALPEGESWTDYHVVAVMTNDLTGQEMESQEASEATGWQKLYWLEKEPQNLKMQYTFTFTVMGDPFFVHYNGASLRKLLRIMARAMCSSITG